MDDRGLIPFKVQRSCPDCGSLLVIRANRTTGSEFLGCRRYPECDHTEPLPESIRMLRAGAMMLPGME